MKKEQKMYWFTGKTVDIATIIIYMYISFFFYLTYSAEKLFSLFLLQELLGLENTTHEFNYAY